MRWRLALALSCLALVALAGCGGETAADREARMQAARADSLAMAQELYNATVFDTVSWESPDARVQRGALVWRASCEKCHGEGGRGDGLGAQQLGIDVPSFLVPDWKYTYEADSLRERIFVGLAGEMPNWGLHGLGYRDIDAAVAYINTLVSAAR
ncbi:MAG: c-type cytochrome [Gemmatimonadota bacterium]|nr:MAG: c-type cytochrome [Gemmatimonadota bacterium]